MQRHKVKQTQQNFRVLQGRSLLQEDEPIHKPKNQVWKSRKRQL